MANLYQSKSNRLHLNKKGFYRRLINHITSPIYTDNTYSLFQRHKASFALKKMLLTGDHKIKPEVQLNNLRKF